MSGLSFGATNWWPTPILTVSQADATRLNEGLRRVILEKEIEITRKGKPKEVAGLVSGLTTHWLEYNVLNWPYPECEELRNMVLVGFREYVKSLGLADDPGMEIVGISCWANVLRTGQSLTLHHHDPAFASAHYTVTTGCENGVVAQSPDSGHTVYYRPGFADRSHGSTANGTVSPWDDDWTHARSPKPGNMTFFPSYVRHEVRPNHGSSERISIALDIFVKKQVLLMYFGGARWFVPKPASA